MPIFSIAISLMLALTTSSHHGGVVTSSSPMAIQNQTLQQPYSWQDPCCFGTDDFMQWSAAGDLAPGESFSYTPPWPTSQASEIPAMSANVRWTGSTTLQLTSTVPMNGQVTNNDPRVNHIGQSLVAPVVQSSASLCMFFSATNDFNYTVTITNTGSQSATGVAFSGQESNGYVSNFNSFCREADADHDGWNDSLEEGTLDFTAPGATTTVDRFSVLGTDYLSASSLTSIPDDEVDSYPPDVDDSGTVNQQDVDRITAWVGQGTGVPLARVNYTGIGPNRYQAQSGLWRRYDLNGDGLVTQADVAWVQAEVGISIPDSVDRLSPWIGFDSLSSTYSRRSSVWIGANSTDNSFLTSVKFYADGVPITQQCNDPFTSGYSNATTPEFQCVWNVPSRRGQVTLTAVATDEAGNTSSDSRTVTVA